MPQQVALVSLSVDGQRVASTTKTAFTGTGEDGQGDLVWRGDLTKGRHTLEVTAEDDQAWGFPYVDPAEFGVDELIVDHGAGSAS
jgi:hypothetical protein